MDTKTLAEVLKDAGLENISKAFIENEEKIPCPYCYGLGRIWDRMERVGNTDRISVSGTMRNCPHCKKTGFVKLSDIKTYAKEK